MAVLLITTLAACGSRRGGSRFASSGPAPVVLRVLAGRAAGGQREVAGFLPSSVIARPGDTLRFVNPTLGTPHTITYAVNDNTRSPQLLLLGARPNPADIDPCVGGIAPPTDAQTCPTPAPQVGADGALTEPFAGQGYYNAGVIGPGGTLDVHLAPTLGAGRYRFRCLIHIGMDVSVQVEAARSGVPGQGALDDLAGRQAARLLATSRPPVRPPGDAPAVTLGGWGRGVTVDQVTPPVVRVPVGGLVTWRNFGPDPHTVAFGSNGQPDATLLRAAASVGEQAAYGGGFLYSGWLSAALGRPTFSLRFATPGRFPFRCAFHPGMTGVVVVGRG